MEQFNGWRTDDGRYFPTKEQAHKWELNHNIIRKYNVTMYFEGVCSLTIEAHDEEEAQKIAEQKYECEDIDFNVNYVEVERVKNNG